MRGLTILRRLALRGCRITNAVKCLPPRTSPSRRGAPVQRVSCRGIRRGEAARVLSLGSVAHRAVLLALRLASATTRFGTTQYTICPPTWR